MVISLDRNQSEIWRHTTTGGLYRIVDDKALLETNLMPVVVYASLFDDGVWVRPTTEFFDGRFVNLAINDVGIPKPEAEPDPEPQPVATDQQVADKPIKPARSKRKLNEGSNLTEVGLKVLARLCEIADARDDNHFGIAVKRLAQDAGVPSSSTYFNLKLLHELGLIKLSNPRGVDPVVKVLAAGRDKLEEQL